MKKNIKITLKREHKTQLNYLEKVLINTKISTENILNHFFNKNNQNYHENRN